ncbi:MAG: sigma-70 family RNA polymerase sigma factor [Candidatus Omnitrophica bacterium]|nr:sigma-70 family RNA polymerase sigma factor [Candidatus Omnitrophota bacterium]
MKDLEFIKRCINKDDKSWEEFLKIYSSLIYSLIWSVLKRKGFSFQNSAYAEEIFQEIFLHLIKDNFKKLRQYKAKKNCPFSSWLKVVVINYTLDYLKRRTPPILSLEEKILDEEKELTLEDTIKDESRPPVDELLLEKELLTNLSECISRLKEDDKFFIEMHIYQGVSLENLKKLLKVSRSAIDMRKARIIQRLKDCFKERGFLLES